jgi:hypothetical protein
MSGRFNANGTAAITRFLQNGTMRKQQLVYEISPTILAGVRLDRYRQGVAVRFVIFVRTSSGKRVFNFQKMYAYLPGVRELQQYIVTYLARITKRRVQNVTLVRNHVPRAPAPPAPQRPRTFLISQRLPTMRRRP